MKIEKIKKAKNGKYHIIFNNEEKLVTYDDVILKHKLLFDHEIDAKLWNQIGIDTKYYDIYNKAVSFISRRLRSEAEIGLYLKQQGAVLEDQTTIIDQLKKAGLINDLMFAKAFVSDRFHLSTAGPGKIQRELEQYHVQEEIMNMALEQLNQVDVHEKLEKLVEKKIKVNTKYSEYLLRQKLTGEFLNLGYPRDMILECFEQKKGTNQTIQKEYDKLKTKLEKKYQGTELAFHIKQKLYQKGYRENELEQLQEK